jgi:hypothetical protein
MKKRCYVAGIVDRNDDWVWQGTVVAPNLREARKMMAAFRREQGLVGRSAAECFLSCITDREVAVYNSTTIH